MSKEKAGIAKKSCYNYMTHTSVGFILAYMHIFIIGHAKNV